MIINCLYCIPALLGVIGVIVVMSMAKNMTMTEPAPAGIDPLSPEAIPDWDSDLERAKFRRKGIIIVVAITILVEAVVLSIPTITKGVKALQPTATPTVTFTPTATNTPTSTKTPTQVPPSATPTDATPSITPTLQATQTPRMIYVFQTVIVKTILPVVITQVVTPTPGPTQTPWIITVVVTETPSPTATLTPEPSATPTP